MSTAQERRNRARKVELGGQLTAGAVGSGFGAAKLRDAYKEDYPASFDRGVKRLHALTDHPKVSPANAARIARLAHAVEHGKPGFKPLAAAVTAGGIATAAHRYQQLSGLREKRRQGVSVPGVPGVRIGKADWGQEMGNLPRYVHVKGIGRCRVIGYHGNGHFRVLDRSDTERLVHRDKLGFERPKKGPTMSKSAFGVEHEVSKTVSEKERKKLAHQKHPMAQPDGSFPIPNKRHAKSALLNIRFAPPGRRASIRAEARRELGKALGQSLVDPVTGKPSKKKVLTAAMAASGGAGLVRLASARPIGKSAFGVEHEVGKAIAFTEKGRRRKAEDAQLRTGLTARERVGAAYGGAAYSAYKAPKGKRIRAAATHVDYMTGGKGVLRGPQRHRTHPAAYARTKQEYAGSGVAKSAFGVTHEVAKAANRKPPSPERVALGTAFGPYHAAVAGKKGKKLSAVGSALGHQLAGGALAGAAMGALTHGRDPGAIRAAGAVGGMLGNATSVYSNQARGRYKPERS